MKTTRIIGALSFVFLTFGALAQNPSDGCAGVPALPVNGACVNTAYTLPGSYANTALIDASCRLAASNKDDGWYSVTATSTGTMTIDLDGSRPHTLAVFTACGGGTELGCDQQNSNVVSSVSFAATNGVTYYVQVHRNNNNNNTDMNGTICAYMGTPAGGVSCGAAEPLTPGTTQCGTNSNVGSFSDNGAVPVNPCNGSYNDGEYWFSYTGTGQALQLDITGLTATYSGLFVLDDCPTASPNCVASYTSGSSTNDFTLTTNALTNGQTYYIVLANWSTPYQTDFCLDAAEIVPPPVPANDNCGGAYPLTVNPDFLCGSTTAGTVLNATPSPSGMGGCFGTDDDDVWFSFVATGPTHTVDILNVAGSVTDMYHSVWASPCPAMTIVPGSCSDANSQTVTGLTAGVTYFVRVYTYTSTSGQNTTFDVCIGTPPPPPANDECTGAFPLTVNPDGACGTVTAGTVASATASPQASGGCFGTDDDDVWFSFVATGTTHYVSLLNVSGSVTDMYHSVWDGCGGGASLVPGTCSDGNSQTVTGLTPGNTYYVRVYTYTSTAGQTSVFDVCIGTPPPPPTNDDCNTAISAVVNPDAVCNLTTPGWCLGSTQSMAGCVGTADDDVWFSFVALDPNQNIEILNPTGTTDMVHEVFSGTCPGGLVSLGCSDPNTSNYTGLTVGDTYYVRVYTYSSTGNNTGFQLCITSPCGISGSAPTCGLNYSHSTIGYNPANYNTGTVLSFPDDQFAPNYTPIGFDFCFDGVSYSDLLVSSNGYLIFPGCYSAAPTAANVTPGGTSAYSMYTDAPNTDDAPRNAIMGPWQDINPSIAGSTIRTSTEGVAPNRVFICKFSTVGMFSCTTLDFHGQIKLFETTNDIEVHIGEKTVCTTWNGGGAILGLHNFDGSTAVIPAGYNYSTQWTVPTNSPEGHAFTNNCGVCTTPLPVELVDFKGQSGNDYNLLTWRTLSEQNNDYFVLETSIGGSEFTAVATIDGAGNSSQAIDYAYRHQNPESTQYYRLRQVDFDGKVSYSDIIVIDTRDGDEMRIYPNPSEGKLFVDLQTVLSSNEVFTVHYVDVSGKMNTEQITMSNHVVSYELPMFNKLDNGLYVVQIIDQTGLVVGTEKIIKK